MLVKGIDKAGEVGERSGQSVNLVDDHHVDAPLPHRLQQPLQRRPLQ